jgi:hypothetical protein
MTFAYLLGIYNSEFQNFRFYFLEMGPLLLTVIFKNANFCRPWFSKMQILSGWGRTHAGAARGEGWGVGSDM